MKHFVLAIGAVVMIGAASAPPLSAFAGHGLYQTVRGMQFLHHPKVRSAVSRASPEEWMTKEILAGGVAGGIVHSEDAFVSGACRPHDCDEVDWTIAVRADGPAAICYHSAQLMGDTSRWFVGGETKLVTRGGCPVDNLPSAIGGLLAATSLR